MATIPSPYSTPAVATSLATTTVDVNVSHAAEPNTGQILTATGHTAATWQTSTGFANPMTTAGDMIYGTSAGTATRLPVGSGSQVLGLSGGDPAWKMLTSGNLPVVPVARGGTGHVTALAGFDALSPMTTAGDLLYGTSSGTATRLGAGTGGQVLTVATSSGLPGWANSASGFTNPMTTKGDLIYGTSSGTANRLAIGSTGQVLEVKSGVPAWATSSALANPMSAVGDTIYGTSSGTATRLAANTTATKKYLTETGTGSAGQAPAWNTISAADVPTLNQNTTGTAANVTGTVAIGNGGTGQTSALAGFDALSPMTTKGDTLYGTSSGTATRLAGNTSATKNFLTQTGTGSVSAAPAWGTIAAGDVPTLTSGNLPTVPIGKGGTGQTSASAGFNALAPVTTTGDLIVGNGSDSSTRLAIGSTNQLLVVSGGTAAWANAGPQAELFIHTAASSGSISNNAVVTGLSWEIAANTLTVGYAFNVLLMSPSAFNIELYADTTAGTQATALVSTGASTGGVLELLGICIATGTSGTVTFGEPGSSIIGAVTVNTTANLWIEAFNVQGSSETFANYAMLATRL